jgi:hypothetical protein
LEGCVSHLAGCLPTYPPGRHPPNSL